MKKTTRDEITRLRKENYSYAAIAEVLGMSKNTVISVCRRTGVKPESEKTIQKNEANYHVCKECGRVFENKWNRKGKVFCSDRCRTNWWNQEKKRQKRLAEVGTATVGDRAEKAAGNG